MADDLNRLDLKELLAERGKVQQQRAMLDDFSGRRRLAVLLRKAQDLSEGQATKLKEIGTRHENHDAR